MIFGYSRFLERQNEILQGRIEALEQRNQELVLAILEKGPAALKPTPTAPQHTMKKSETTATCSCGWNTFSEDPVKLQQEITNHYRGFATPAGRRTWSQARATLEAAGEKNA